MRFSYIRVLAPACADESIYSRDSGLPLKDYQPAKHGLENAVILLFLPRNRKSTGVTKIIDIVYLFVSGVCRLFLIYPAILYVFPRPS